MKKYSEHIEKAMEQLPKGAFLTTEKDGKVNTMTIGWGGFGFAWGIPTLEVMVRESRFTKAAMDKTDVFTVTIPYGEDMKEALGYCGRVSGRDTDKIADCKLTLAKARELEGAAVVSCKGLVIECKTVMRLPMQTEATDNTILDKWYKNGDLHTIYYGGVVDCYEID